MPKLVDHEARRLELMEVVVRLIARGGMEAATIREIARESGHSKGVVEHYFDNKEEMISAALEWVNLRYGERTENATGSLRGLSAIRKMIEATLPLTDDVRDEWRVRMVFWSAAAIDDDLKQQQGARFGKAVEQFAGHLLEAVADGELLPGGESAENSARRLVNTTSGIAIAALHNDAYSSRDFLEAEIDHLITGLSGVGQELAPERKQPA